MTEDVLNLILWNNDSGYFPCYNIFVAPPILQQLGGVYNEPSFNLLGSSHGRYGIVLPLQRTRLASFGSMRQLV